MRGYRNDGRLKSCRERLPRRFIEIFLENIVQPGRILNVNRTIRYMIPVVLVSQDF